MLAAKSALLLNKITSALKPTPTDPNNFYRNNKRDTSTFLEAWKMAKIITIPKPGKNLEEADSYIDQSRYSQLSPEYWRE